MRIRRYPIPFHLMLSQLVRPSLSWFDRPEGNQKDGCARATVSPVPPSPPGCSKPSLPPHRSAIPAWRKSPPYPSTTRSCVDPTPTSVPPKIFNFRSPMIEGFPTPTRRHVSSSRFILDPHALPTLRYGRKCRGIALSFDFFVLELSRVGADGTTNGRGWWS